MSDRSRLVLVWRAAASCLLGALLVLSKLGCASNPDSEPPSTMPICPYTGTTPFLDPTAFPECPVTACPGIPMGNRAAHCISNAAIGSLGVASDVLAQLGPCDEGSRCVPDLFAGYMLTKLPKTCRSLRGADGKPVEGRCLSRCLTQVHDMEGMLPQTSDGACDDATELCAPCYDPRHGMLLPACTLGSLPDGGTCDKPKEPMTLWQRCCDNGGTCLPNEVIPPAKAKNLAQKECPSTFKCAPQVAVEDPNWSPRECRTGGGPLGVAFSKDGRCVPICALDTTGFAGTLKNLVLNQGVDEDGFKICAEAEKCAPCKNLGSDTGACDL